MLQLEDRKSVRLVCRTWYHCSTCWSITKNEEFVLLNVSKVKDFTEMITKSNRVFLNLKFDRILQMNDLGTNLWKMCGHRVQALECNTYYGDGETIKKIIMYCKNLIQFNLKISAADNDEFLCLSQFLDELVKKGTKRTKLRSLRMFIPPYNNIVLSKIILLYPCISNFIVNGTSDNSIFSIPISLQSLTFYKYDRSSEWLKVCITKAKQGLRLRKFVVLLMLEELYPMRETLFNFFSSQENLHVVSLQLECRSLLRRSFQLFLEAITFHILESCPNLQKFSMLISIFVEPLKKLPRFFSLISKLQYLNINFSIEPLDVEASKLLQIPINLALTTLHLSVKSNKIHSKDHSEDHNEILCNVLLPHCPLLVHLKLGNTVLYSTMLIIFKYLLKLQTLILHDIKKGANTVFNAYDVSREGKYSIERLQRIDFDEILLELRYLEIQYHCDVECIQEIVLEHHLAQLEFLKMNFRLEEVPEEVLTSFAFQVPKLKELLVLDCKSEVNMKKIIQICENLKKLDLLNIYQSAPIEQIEEIFHMCPTLRYISDCHKKLGRYSFERLTDGTLKRTSGDIFKRFGSAKYFD